MNGILQMIAQHLDPATITAISNQVGIDPNTAQNAISAALPGVFGAMAEHANSDSGATEIHDAVQQTAPAAAGNAPPPADPGLLDKLMGHRTAAVQQNVAQASGIDLQQAGKLLTYLAPIALTMLSRQRAQQLGAAQGPGGLSDILRSVQQATQGSGGAGGLGGGLGGLIGSMLG